MFGRGWQRAEAKVIDTMTKQGFNMNTTATTWVVEVRPSGGEAFRAEVKEPAPIRAKYFVFPKEGQVYSVLFDPKSRKVKWDLDDPRLSQKAQASADRDRLDAALRAPVESDDG